MRYTATARLLHWLSVAMLLAIGALGLWLGWAAPKGEALKLRLYNIHESLGITLLAVTLLRLGWRLGHPPPPIRPRLAAPMRWAAMASHRLLYALLLTMPVVGLLATNAWGFPLTAYGVLPIPSPMGRDEILAPLLTALHGWMALVLGLTAGLHGVAALYHHAIRRDDTLRRML